ncbi:LPXTG cell wall anchor domain-containing protein [Lachnospiraceae bacterium ZAX-1]
MGNLKNIKKQMACICTAIVLISPLAIPKSFAVAAADVPNMQSLVNTYDFFRDKYSNLSGKEHVFQTAEFAQIYHYFLGGVHNGTGSFWATLTKNDDGTEKWSGKRGYEVNIKSGNHIFLLGGTWSAELQESIGYINDVAKEYEIPAIYNFDPHLDGKAESGIDLFADPGQESDYGTLAEFNAKTYFRQRGDALATALLSYNDGMEEASRLSADQLSTPSIIIWNKDNAFTPLVAQYTWDAATAADEETFKTGLRAAFDTIATDKKANDIVHITPSEYFIENENARFLDSYGASTTPLLTVEGEPIMVNGITQQGKDTTLFTAADTYTPLEVVTYEELRGLLSSSGNYAFVFAGQWCPNTYANLRDIHDYALLYNLDKVYFFDPELDGTMNNSITAIRNSDRSYTSGLYIELLGDVLTNIGPDGIPTQFDEAYQNYILSEDMRRAASGQPALTDEEKLQIRLTNAGDSGDGYSIYQKVPGNTDKGYAPIENAKWVPRLQQPAMLMFNKDHKDANGNPAPVISMFEQMWFSGGNLAAPNTFGGVAAKQGRIVEFQEYIYRDDVQPDTLHGLGLYDITDNQSIPKTSIAAYSATGEAGGADIRGINTPITMRSYWYGLNETFNALGVSVLYELIEEAKGSESSDAALQTALDAAKRTVSNVQAADDAARATDLAKVNAPVSESLSDISLVRLTAPELVGSFTNQSSKITTAYAALATALGIPESETVFASEAATAPATNKPAAELPATSSTPKTNSIAMIGAIVLVFVGAVTLLLKKRKKA